MQTFLPYPDFALTAQSLDPRRLGKQRVETIQVLRGLTWPGYGWRHHPAVKMWTGYEEALVRYGLEVCAVWCAAGRADTCAATLHVDYAAALATGATEPGDAALLGTAAPGGGRIRSQAELAEAGELPPWLGLAQLHLSHRSSLVRKDPEYYRPIFGDVPPDVPYVWPVSDRERSRPAA